MVGFSRGSAIYNIVDYYFNRLATFNIGEGEEGVSGGKILGSAQQLWTGRHTWGRGSAV